jgi:hypothetical protein
LNHEIHETLKKLPHSFFPFRVFRVVRGLFFSSFCISLTASIKCRSTGEGSSSIFFPPKEIKGGKVHQPFEDLIRCLESEINPEKYWFSNRKLRKAKRM